MSDSEFCYQHDPRVKAERDAHLERMRAAA
jgi:hypothetical protein